MNLNIKEDYDRLKGIAKALTKRFNKPELTDDLVSFASEAIVRGRKATVKQLYVDFLRQEFGDSRGLSSTFKLANALEWEDYMDMEVLDSHSVDFNKIVNSFKGEDKAVLVLYYQWSLTMKEIGNVFGCSEASISIRFKEINNKLKGKFGHA